MDNLLENLENYYKNCENENNSSNEKTVYDELAEKEQALTLAAQFGKTLLEEKEQLELQIESIKKDYQSKIEALEQERYALKLLIESIRNEYENKIYELNEDINLMHKQLESQQNELNLKLNEKNALIEIINELTDKNQKLISEINLHRANNFELEEKYTKMQIDFEDNEDKYADNLKLINSYKKEIASQIKKQGELEYLLMRTCNDLDLKSHLLEDKTNQLEVMKAKKHELDEIVFQQEQQILDLQALSEDLNHKIEKYHLNSGHRINRSRYNNNLLQKFNRTNTNKSNNNNNNNAKSLYEEVDEINYGNGLDLFRVEDDELEDRDTNDSELNWQDECQINEQQISQNSIQSDDFEDNNSLSSSSFNKIVSRNEKKNFEIDKANDNNKFNNNMDIKN